MYKSQRGLSFCRMLFLTVLCLCWQASHGQSQAEVAALEGPGKRSISEDEMAEYLAEREAEARLHSEEDAYKAEMEESAEDMDDDLAVDKRNPYSFGLGKRALGNEYGFGLGKRNPYAFGLGKRALHAPMQLGKKDDPIYAFGLGKRNPYAFGLGKRNPYAFGLGKRNPYAFGLGKKRDPYAFGLGKRDPYSFGLGK